MAALQTGMQWSNADVFALWCIAISLTMWFDKGEIAVTRRFAICDTASRQQRSPARGTNCRRSLALLGVGCRIRHLTFRRKLRSRIRADQRRHMKIRTRESPSITSSPELPRAVTFCRPKQHKRYAIWRNQRRSGEAEIRAKIFGAIGANEPYAATWSHIDRNVAGSVHCLASVATDDELWLAVAALAREYKDSDYWPDSLAANLDRLAIERAKVRGLDHLLIGLNHHLTMHSRWAFGGGPLCPEVWVTLPECPAGLTWRDIAIRLFDVLFGSYSAEVLGAASEGMHSLVAVDNSVIPQLFQTLTTGWQCRWLLIAAEAWAALYPEAMSSVSADLQGLMHQGTLQERLQAWIVLCKLSDMTQIGRPAFPLPEESGVESVRVPVGESRLLHVPSIKFGSRSLIGRFSGAESTLRHLKSCGWDFSPLEADYRTAIARPRGTDKWLPKHSGPHRRGDFSCTRLDGENAISAAILSVLSAGVCDETGIVRLAQGFLDNEDGWLQAVPLRPASRTDLWPPDEIGNRNEMSSEEIKDRLTQIATGQDVPSGWRTFCAHVFFYTWNKDFELRLWWEQAGNDLILRPSHCPSCPSGRSFLWWLGDFFQPEADVFVSGFFVGGRQRLNYDHFEIQPAKVMARVLWVGTRSSKSADMEPQWHGRCTIRPSPRPRA